MPGISVPGGGATPNAWCTASDRERDIRGMSIQVANVVGENFTPGATTQDFVLNSHPVMLAGTTRDFLELLRANEAGGIRRVADEDIASESVKQAIKKIIEEENKASPMSDQAIVQLLEQEHGIKIARRTVAKYRELMGILPSSKRKQVY